MLTLSEMRRAGRFAFAASEGGIAFRYYPERQPYGADGPAEVEFVPPDSSQWMRALVREDALLGWCFWRPERWPLPESEGVTFVDTRFAISVPQNCWHHVADCDCDHCRGEIAVRPWETLP